MRSKSTQPSGAFAESAYTSRSITSRSRLLRIDSDARGDFMSFKMSGASDSHVCWATDCSAGSHAFVVSIDRPFMPARLRR